MVAGVARGQISPSRCALTTAPVRLRVPSFARMWATCHFAVPGDTPSCAARSALVTPVARTRRTSSSRAVSDSTRLTVRAEPHGRAAARSCGSRPTAVAESGRELRLHRGDEGRRKSPHKGQQRRERGPVVHEPPDVAAGTGQPHRMAEVIDGPVPLARREPRGGLERVDGDELRDGALRLVRLARRPQECERLAGAALGEPDAGDQ